MTILKKREDYREAYDRFKPEVVASYTDPKIQKLLQNEKIVRNKLKIAASVTNARAFLKVQEEFGSFNNYIWGYVDGRPIINSWKNISQIPAVTPLAETISKDLKKRGFKFVGPTIIYAHMQAIGLVNDHMISCFRYDEINRMVGT
jgi:DNA-3-methyladenine glycosylase I